jgi:hypothetical protein
MQGRCHGRVRSIRMDDLGAPGSYMTLGEGVPVYSSDRRRLGEVLGGPAVHVHDHA